MNVAEQSNVFLKVITDAILGGGRQRQLRRGLQLVLRRRHKIHTCLPSLRGIMHGSLPALNYLNASEH
jgi:hypothetical protein